jgi:quercetin dioxygenase-like cupin family protein
MKRHRALIPLSHDHHDALVAARRLRQGADAQDPTAAATAFLAFFADSAVPHFREEEELLFPRVADTEEARELIVQALLEHQRLHAAAAELREVVSRGSADPALGARMRELATLLDGHVRLEERRLFPLIETLLPEETLTALVNPVAHEGSGPAWGTESEELNATLLYWRAGEGPPDHVNAELDVLVVVLAGSAIVSTDEDERELAVGEATIIAKGRRRKISAGREGVRYLSVHRRRPPLQIAPAPRRRV